MNLRWKTMPFSDAIADESAGHPKIPQSEFLPTGRFAIVDQGKDLVAGYANNEAHLCKVKLPAIVFGDHTKCLKYIDFPFCMGADGIKVLRPKVEVDVRYIYHYLRQLKITDGGYDRHFKYLKRSDILLPPFSEQRRITAILDKADELRAKRRVALSQLDVLIQSIFLEMFGDPGSNPQGWPSQTLGEVTEKITDGEHLNPQFSQSGMKLVMAGNVLDDRIDLENCKMVERSLGEKFRRKCGPAPGDLLVVSRGATIGRLCVVDSNDLFCLMGSVILIKPRVKLMEAQFLAAFLKHPLIQNALYKTSGSSAQQAMYLKDLTRLSCVVPPLTLQNEFAKRVTAVQEMKAAYRASLAKLDELFASLQHRAFRGEL